MSDTDRAAQLEYILDHYENPRHHGPMPDADVHFQGGNPGCGDIVAIYLKLKDGRIDAISFEGQGCTISQASASMLTERVQGMSIAEIEQLDYQVIEEEIGEELVKTRPRCATLGLDTLKATLQEYRRQQARGDK